MIHSEDVLGGKVHRRGKFVPGCGHKNCGRRNVRKQKDIRGSDKCVTLDISEKFDSLNKMETTSSESKVELERSGKGLVTALALKTKARSKKYKRQGMPSEMSA